MKKRTIILVIAIALSVVLGIVLSIPTLKCEILTLQHGTEFESHKSDWDWGGDCLKVIEYDDESAEVYFYSTEEGGLGSLVSFVKEENIWTFESWDTLWSDGGGNADDVLPQYWWHWIYFRLPRQPYS